LHLGVARLVAVVGQVHLPFDEAVKWVRTTGVDFWGWKSKEDWIDWLHQGEGMSQYIPSDPGFTRADSIVAQH